MGRLNELLGPAANFSRGLATMFGLQEQEGVPTVAPELVPVSDIHARPEQWALHGGTLLMGTIQVAAGGAGNTSQCAIEPGAGEVVIVERLVYQPLASSLQVALFSSSTPLTTSTGNLVARDARRIVTAGGGAASGTRIRTENGVFGGSASTLFNLGTNLVAGEVYDIPLDVVLVSPWSLRLANLTSNAVLGNANWFVRVRPGTPRELTSGAQL